MKKKIYSLLMLAIAAFAFTSCEDVPMPYDKPGFASETDEPMVLLTGDGTVENPYSVASALYLITEGKITEDKVYVEGTISKIDEIDTSTQYGNATYYISDDGSTTSQLEVFRGYNLGGAKFKSNTDIKVGDKVIIYGQLVYYNQKTPEFTQGSSIYSLNGQTAGGDEPAGEAKGSGTQADPFNVAGAIVKCKEIGTTAPSETYYVKGTVVEGATADESFNNITFDIADTEGGAKFKCYQVKGTDGKDLPKGFSVNKGDEVVVCGPIYNYSGNTPETAGKSAAYIVSVNGKATSEGGSDTPQPSGSSTIDNPYTVEKALEMINALSDNESTTESFYIKGKVTRKANTADEIGPNSSKKYKDMNYYISDDGSKSYELYVYRGKYLEGADFTDYEQLKENDEVIIYGQLQKYIDTKNGNAVVPEVKNSKIVKLNGKTTDGGSGEQSGPGTISGNTITVNAIDFGVSNGVAMGTQTLADGTKLEFDGGGNSNAPKYYDTGTNIRMYPKNSVTITASKDIEKVVFNCDEYQGTICNASGDITASPGTVTVDGKVVTVKQVNSKTSTITNTSSSTGAASQIRIISIEITYAN